MKKTIRRILKWDGLRDLITYVVLALWIALVHIFVTNSRLAGRLENKTIKAYILVTLLLVMAIEIYRMYRGELKDSRQIELIILLGCVMRIGYGAFNDILYNTHDMWYIDDLESKTKGAYLGYLLLLHKLPDTYEVQLYHQPFSYLMSALSCILMKPFIHTDEIYWIGNAAKLSNCLASCVTLCLVPKLCDEIGMNERSKRLATLFVAFVPGFYIISGTVTEDAFYCLFLELEILYTLRYRKDPTWKNLVILALSYGFGLNTGLSCILPAPYTAYVFLERMFRLERKGKENGVSVVPVKDRMEYIRTGIFAAISFPLGLWGYIRNRVLFGIPFTYIHEQDPEGALFRGNNSLWERFKFFDWKDFVESPYIDIWQDSNLPAAFIKSELYDEFSWSIARPIPTVMLWIDILLTVFTIVAGIIFFRKMMKNGTYRVISILGIWIALFEIYSYLKQPFSCSMLARYFLILVILKGVCFGILAGEYLQEKRFSRVFNAVCGIALILFGALSCVMFCMENI